MFKWKQGILNCWYAYLAAGFQLKNNSLSQTGIGVFKCPSTVTPGDTF